MSILLQASALCGPSNRDKATIDCLWVAFVFLLRPGEYANSSGDAKHPFCLQDVIMKIGDRSFKSAFTATYDQLLAATFCT
eukprot:CAMPEP_0197738092 /NCGR_PEP_ID=MMETSP1435-20131217/12606_1 /TAXON_ID=426625 /ORGANISM="Chaetoceros brevis, Strain CCMP164" /LENGTH=80 /DNA_ID=CAMNT_0043326859 /DNA_START=17 /DNA_END=256 /DNA_ORIENTATION=+